MQEYVPSRRFYISVSESHYPPARAIEVKADTRRQEVSLYIGAGPFITMAFDVADQVAAMLVDAVNELERARRSEQ